MLSKNKLFNHSFTGLLALLQIAGPIAHAAVARQVESAASEPAAVMDTQKLGIDINYTEALNAVQERLAINPEALRDPRFNDGKYMYMLVSGSILEVLGIYGLNRWAHSSREIKGALVELNKARLEYNEQVRKQNYANSVVGKPALNGGNAALVNQLISLEAELTRLHSSTIAARIEVNQRKAMELLVKSTDAQLKSARSFEELQRSFAGKASTAVLFESEKTRKEFTRYVDSAVELQKRLASGVIKENPVVLNRIEAIRAEVRLINQNELRQSALENMSEDVRKADAKLTAARTKLGQTTSRLGFLRRDTHAVGTLVRSTEFMIRNTLGLLLISDLSLKAYQAVELHEVPDLMPVHEYIWEGVKSVRDQLDPK